MDLQLGTEKRRRFPSMMMTPEYICGQQLSSQTGSFRITANLKVRLAANQCQGKVLHGACFVGVVEPGARLHDVIKGEPLLCSSQRLAHRRRMQAYSLVVSNVPPAFPISGQDLWEEAPCNDRVKNQVIVRVVIDRPR